MKLGKQNPPLDLNALQQMLSFAESETSRDQWVTILMSIKSEFGDSAKGVAQEWSATASSYDAKDFLSTWMSIKENGAVTIGTLIHQAKANGWTPEPISTTERKRLEQERKQRQAENAQRAESEAQAVAEQHQRASEHAYRILESAKPAPANHLYLQSKQVDAHGVLFGSVLSYGNALIIPIYGTQAPFVGEVQNVQSIFATGDKYFLKGGKKSGGYYPIQWVEGAPIVICEGFATGATLAEHYTPFYSVVIAFDSGNLLSVAKVFRKQYPTQQIILAGDNDRFTKDGKPAEKNPGIEAATKAAKAVAGLLSIPHFAPNEMGSDWNDRYLLDKQKELSA
ncbi:PriCT-2 domain-containing protein [Thiomicrorhabdus indica]|uniref:PriCT-2 domain-containing protein n=1 Tax=Thiomicrorhabdus indica TaxID=2267253 RepID=UPI002AA8C58F|nr:PriCT-2 domain-containing protein [Thiomicrorhabdus indica]